MAQLIRHDGQLYDFPDQLASMTTIPRGILTYDSHLWKSYHDVKKTWSEKVGLSGSLLGGMFGGSKSKQRMLHTINAMENYVEDVSSFVSGSRAEFQPPWLLELNSGSQAFIDRFLPTTYSADPAAYDIFISYYGTHFFEQAQFGGILKMTMETAKSYVSSEGDVSTQLNAEASFKNWLSVMGASSSSTHTIDKKFTDATHISKKYYGGVGNLLGDSSYANWVPTIAGNPWMFAGELKPLTLLFTDTEKAAAMDYAVKIHKNSAWLAEMKRLLEAFITSLDNIKTTGNWQEIKACNTHGQIPNVCQMTKIFFMNIGCVVDGCQHKYWLTNRESFKQKARDLMPRIEAEIGNRGFDSDNVARIGSDTERLLTNMDTKAPLVTKRVQQTGVVCSCGGSCTCSRHVFATVTAPEPFFRKGLHSIRFRSKKLLS